MTRPRLTLLVPLVASLAIVGGLHVLGGAHASEEESATEPARVVKVAGTDLRRVILTAEAARRVDVHTARVRTVRVRPGTPLRPSIPYGALLYDAHGRTYTYLRLAPLTFQRQRVTVRTIDGDRVILAGGLRAGVAVVTVGAAELLGTETGAGDES
jgi:hypothetical protein